MWSIYGYGVVMTTFSVSSTEWLTPVVFGATSGVIISLTVFEFWLIIEYVDIVPIITIIITIIIIPIVIVVGILIFVILKRKKPKISAS